MIWLAFYLAAMVALVVRVDRRLTAAQRRRESAFGSGLLVSQFERRPGGQS